MFSWPPVSAMVPSRAAGANRIKSAPGALLAATIASRKDPGPASRTFRTEKVLNNLRCSSGSSLAPGSWHSLIDDFMAIASFEIAFPSSGRVGATPTNRVRPPTARSISLPRSLAGGDRAVEGAGRRAGGRVVEALHGEAPGGVGEAAGAAGDGRRLDDVQDAGHVGRRGHAREV